ncbi:hypothetical protein C8Q80DRAFT_1264311 [Daedaleopsis nitida]|nr:hypothetical protein C8Q80DRAFT_1264311 [Daedaleopsis nitida]
MKALSFLSLWFPILFCRPCLSVQYRNVTIDDNDQSHDVLQYLPSHSWAQGASCNTCPTSHYIDLGEALHNTWHVGDFTVGPSNELDIILTFTGTAVYVYNIIINKPYPGQEGTLTTFTNISFYMDGEFAANYVHFPETSTHTVYDVPVYSTTALHNTTHSLHMRVYGSTSSLVLFDYATYTVAEPDESTRLSTSSSSAQNTLAFTVVLVIASLCLAGVSAGAGVMFYRRRQSASSKAIEDAGDPNSRTPRFPPDNTPSRLRPPSQSGGISTSSATSDSTPPDTPEAFRWDARQFAMRGDRSPRSGGSTPTILPPTPSPPPPSHSVDVPGPAVTISEATTERQNHITAVERELYIQEERLRRLERGRGAADDHGGRRLRVVGGSVGDGDMSGDQAFVSGRDEKIALLRIEVDALRMQVEFERRLLSEVAPRRPRRR